MDARYKIAEAMMRGVGQPMAAFPDQRQDDDMSLRGMASDLYQADNRRAQDYRAGIKEAILQSWPAELAKVPYNFADFANRVYQGKADPMSDEAIQRSADIAGLMTLGSGAVPAGRNEMRMGIKAYHGSPHDFDRFDMSKIGTGEGAQAYGHGLYFAEKEGIARSYRDALTGPRPQDSFAYDTILGMAKAGSSPAEKTAAQYLAMYGDELGALQNLKGMSKASSRGMFGPEIADAAKWLEDAIRKVPTHNPGRMYEVNLNTTPDRLLDWDAPLAQQPKEMVNIVRDALKREGYLRPNDNGPRQLQSAISSWRMERGGISDTPMQALLSGNRSLLGPDQVAVSQTLKEAGIPGIKYLDAGSRAAGDGSRNYVMFDDKLVQILRKYGVATAAALPAAALAELGMSREEAKRSF
jgi:hypothetical protein